ncbi:hypothetical protein HanRHA438_Chr04g0171391 [Helianthus annuus]|uniref:Uncharacterized protein n=1 Tax=Helianthus annuus TaxID=4232 RepID=A0A9K3NRD9_HELAN|nr:hypothetical protein HanXRQr2_Chr04g0161261 [Helianthus annuus]KAJ0580733.1 hypothetical protein HanHA300_Chr04g0132751 [Helianthus annuus]KAJ0588406.1 hypothetical protein HanIR_Chr04g0174291 [Helianthus annuus]KAJ0596682.1 hypothetical protein HanHA89_Chr04g0145711 [Helianthus annuus]KAJ0757349.1 hypothetical protein HanLR1_Chr04g0137711 [Helianthus annuus]
MEEVLHNISFDQPNPNLDDIIFNRALAAIDATLESGIPSSSTSKGKGILVEEEDDVQMLTERKYLGLVRKDFLGKLSAKGQEKLKAFRDKVGSLGPSSEWALRLSLWNEKNSDLSNLPKDSPNSNIHGDPDRRPITVSAVESRPVVTYKRRRLDEGSSSTPMSSKVKNVSTVDVSAIVVPIVTGGLSILGVHVSLPSVSASMSIPSTTDVVSVMSASAEGQSSSASVPVITSGVSTTPLFTTFPALPGFSNVFATSMGVSSSSLPPVFLAVPPGSSSSFV